jgi:tRNA A-37 threonylcarbamoyl transferase component Bud32
MLEIDAHNALDYLRGRGWLDAGISARVEPLAWGVSNVVLRVDPEGGIPLVIKQSRAQLRTKDPWFSRIDRIWRETAASRCLAPLLPAGVIPRVLFEDRENYLFAMEAAPRAHVVWKQLLLEGRVDAGVARRLGSYLGAMHLGTANHPDLKSQFGDTEIFVQLRVDPFYRRVAAAESAAAPSIDRLIAEMFALPVCLVHADFSPKNVLIAGERIVLVDFETAHYGDPAFDLGFFLSHLLLKSIHRASQFAEFAALTCGFWESYLASLGGIAGRKEFAPDEIFRRTTGHLAGCMWARIDGTSKIDYLDDAGRNMVREFCRSLLADPPADWQLVLVRLERLLSDRLKIPAKPR